MVASIAGTSTVTAPAAGASASGTSSGGFGGMLSGLLNVPGGTNGHGGIPPLAQIAASAVSSLVLANPFGFASTLFMGFAKELIEMGPDTSRPPLPVGMSNGQESGVQPVTPGTLKQGEYTSLSTTTPAFLAGAGQVLVAADAGRGQEADMSLAGLPGVGMPAAPVSGAPSGTLAVAQAMPATGSEQGVSVGLPGVLGAAPAATVLEAGAAPATNPAATAANPATTQLAASTPATTQVATNPAATPGAATTPAVKQAATAAPIRPTGWISAYAGMSEFQRAQAVERGLA